MAATARLRLALVELRAPLRVAIGNAVGRICRLRPEGAASLPGRRPDLRRRDAGTPPPPGPFLGVGPEPGRPEAGAPPPGGRGIAPPPHLGPVCRGHGRSLPGPPPGGMGVAPPPPWALPGGVAGAPPPGGRGAASAWALPGGVAGAPPPVGGGAAPPGPCEEDEERREPGGKGKEKRKRKERKRKKKKKKEKEERGERLTGGTHMLTSSKTTVKTSKGGDLHGFKS